MPLPSSIGRVKAAALAAVCGGAAGRRRDFLRPSWQGKSTKNHAAAAAAAARAAKEEHTYEVKEFQNQDQDGPGSAM